MKPIEWRVYSGNGIAADSRPATYLNNPTTMHNAVIISLKGQSLVKCYNVVNIGLIGNPSYACMLVTGRDYD